VAVEHAMGENPVPVDYDKVPWVVYTEPEVAWSGLTEAQAKEAGHDVVVHKHSFAGNGRAMILGETEGLVKVVAAKDGPILGFHLAGPWASELLHEGYLSVNWDALPNDVGRLIHAHPSLSEAIGETMITFSGRSLHG
jgi:dihydrolipoamide dehydrogenase